MREKHGKSKRLLYGVREIIVLLCDGDEFNPEQIRITLDREILHDCPDDGILVTPKEIITEWHERPGSE
jgi:hypothetical protein